MFDLYHFRGGRARRQIYFKGLMAVEMLKTTGCIVDGELERKDPRPSPYKAL
jgi:hypothetical protein